MHLESSTDKQSLDLSSHYVVLGSGLNAISTIHGILDNCDDVNKKIIIIDASIKNGIAINQSQFEVSHKLPSPKFKIGSNSYVYENFSRMLNINSNGFHPIGSLAKGGLSNIWGGGIQPYNEEELSKYPYSYNEVKNIYSKIYGILTGSEINYIDLEKGFGERDNFSIREPLLAIKDQNNGENFCSIKSCATGCIYCNRNIFNSSHELDHLLSFDKLEYKPGLYVASIDYLNGYYSIKCINVSTGKIIQFKATNVYSCLGALSTTKIVLGMSKSTTNQPLLTTPGGIFLSFSFRNFRRKNHQIFAAHAFSGKVGQNSFDGALHPVSENLLSVYLGENLGRLAYKLFGSFLLSRIFIANMFFSSDLSSSSMLSIDNEVKINSEISPNLETIFLKAVKTIKKGLYSKGLWVLPFGKKILQPGQDVHYGGLLPMKKYPTENECDFNGELWGFKNFYVADSASMPFLASKGHSFNSMVNAYYISSKSIKRKSKKIHSSV